jgi:hypothetical protein
MLVAHGSIETTLRHLIAGRLEVKPCPIFDLFPPGRTSAAKMKRWLRERQRKRMLI